MRGMLLLHDDPGIQREARRRRLDVMTLDAPAIPWPQTLITEGLVPWDLVDAGYHFIERWDAAAPLWRYGVLAQDLGTKAERAQTKGLVRDLRVPVYAADRLLFVRQSPEAEQLLVAWDCEREGGADPMLAFLRALYRVKPLFLALPRSWLAENIRTPLTAGRRPGRMLTRLVRVQIAPGRFVTCKPGEEETTKALWAARLLPRLKRRR